MFTNHVEMRYNVTNKLPIAPLVAPLDDNDSVSVLPEVQYLQYDMVTYLLKNCNYLVTTAYLGAYVREYCTVHTYVLGLKCTTAVLVLYVRSRYVQSPARTTA